MIRLIQFSDTHLRATHWRHQRRFSRALRKAGMYDMAVITGDLSVDGAGIRDDLEIARQRFDGMRGPLHVLPGNHDIGEEPASTTRTQPVTPERLARFRDVFGTDRFDISLPGWRLVGLNVHLFGTGWAEESDQWALLEAAIAGRGDDRLGVFLHKPLFVEAPDEPENAYHCIAAPARDRLLSLAGSGKAIAFFASGHLHQGLIRKSDGITHVWAPATANAASTPRSHGVLMSTGFAVWQFTPGRFRVGFETL